MNNTKARGLYLPGGSFHRFAEADDRKTLADHVASRDRAPDFTALGAYLPNPDPILKKLGRDAAVYRDLLSDPHVGGCVRRRKAAVKGMEWRIVDSVAGQSGTRADQKASPRAMMMAQDALADLKLDSMLGEILGAPLFGWVPMEIIWHQYGGALLPKNVMAKPQEWFHFDPAGELRFKTRQNQMQGEELQARKFLVPKQDASYANPYGFADLAMCFWPTTFKRGGLKFWVTFAEKFGTPWVVGKQPRNAGPKETNQLLDQLEAMVQDAVAVVPDDSSVDIHESAGKGDTAGAYESLLMFCRSEVAIALLGQNQSTEASANKASASAGLEVADDLKNGDARLVEESINQLLRWVTDLNESEDAPAPRFELFEPEEISDIQARRDETLNKAGAVFTPQYFHRAYGFQVGDIAAEGSAPPALSKDEKAAEFAEATAPGQVDALDQLVDAELGQWEQAMQPLVDPLQEALDLATANGETAAQLIARLPAILERMNPQAMADALTRMALTARLGAAAGIPTAGDQAATVLEG